MPRTATTSPGRAPLWRSALKVVMPAHSRGAASVRRQFLGNGRQRLKGSNHEIGVAAVVADPGDLRGFAGDEVAAPAGNAVAAVPAVPAHADAHAGFPLRHVRAHRVDDSNDLVAGYAGKFYARKCAHLGECIAVADTAGLHLDADLPRPGRGNIALD